MGVLGSTEQHLSTERGGASKRWGRVWLGSAAALATLALIVGLTGCGGYDGRTAKAGYIDKTSAALTVKCGANKYSGPQGADVSYFQGNFVWSGKGLKFGYARISDGTGFVDPKFSYNWGAMKSAGILRGAYQFFEPGQSATAQANMMVSDVGHLGAGEMPCMVDVETAGGQSGSTIASKLKTWLNIVQQGTGKKPVIYTGGYFWQGSVGSTAFGSYPLWIAAYGPSCPSIPAGWSNWTIWQYCDGNTAYCSNGAGFDRDVFNGSNSALTNFAGNFAYGAQFVAQSFPLASTALKMTEGQTIASYIKLKNVGTKSWDTNTRIGTTQPRDRTSVFADSSWISPSRPAGVTSGTVAPGATYKFKFNLHAPNQTGTFKEYFGVVEEHVTWFSAGNEGGPPDNQLEVQIKVVAPTGSGGSGGSTGSGGAAGAAGAAGGPVVVGTGGAAGAGAGGYGDYGGYGNSGGYAGSPGEGGPSETTYNVGKTSPGCSCRVGARSPGEAGAPLALLFVFGWVVERRRGRRQRRL